MNHLNGKFHYFLKSPQSILNIVEGRGQRALHAIDYLILDTATFILQDYTRFTITDTGRPRLTSLYNQVPGAGSVALADAPQGALHCLVDVFTTADPRVLVPLAASVQPATVVSVPGTAEGASDGCTE